MLFMLFVIFGGLFLTMYLESPNRRDDSEINELVKQSVEREKHLPRNRAYRYMKAGWKP